MINDQLKNHGVCMIYWILNNFGFRENSFVLININHDTRSFEMKPFTLNTYSSCKLITGHILFTLPLNHLTLIVVLLQRDVSGRVPFNWFLPVLSITHTHIRYVHELGHPESYRS